ncbi:MAG: hypothetical protein KDJ67_06285 [Nitratireductor sp.]|nr:hypothetical protein [Nitratireductor sp.]
MQLIALGLIGVLVWYAWRALQREMTRINNAVRKAEKPETDKPQASTPGRKGDVTILEPGEDGVYRPKDD